MKKLQSCSIEIEDPTCPVCCETYAIAGKFYCGHAVCAKCALTYFFVRYYQVCLLCGSYAHKMLVAPYLQAIGKFEAIIHEPNIRFLKKRKLYVHYSAERYYEYLFNPACSECGKTCESFSYLQKHSFYVHKKRFCQVCVHSAIALPASLVMMSYNDMNRHVGMHSHCVLCHAMSYDQTALELHYKEKHERCEICRFIGVDDSYWKNRGDLYAHVRYAHIYCKFSSCAEVCLGFARRLDYIEHMLSVHFSYLSPAHICDLYTQAEGLSSRIEPGLIIEAIREYSLAQRVYKAKDLHNTHVNRRVSKHATEPKVIHVYYEEAHAEAEATHKQEEEVEVVYYDFGDLLAKMKVIDLHGYEGLSNNVLLETCQDEFLQANCREVVISGRNLVLASNNVVFLQYYAEEREMRAVRCLGAKVMAFLRFDNSKTLATSFNATDADMPRFGRLLAAFCTASSHQLYGWPAINSKIRSSCFALFKECKQFELIIVGDKAQHEATLQLLTDKYYFAQAAMINRRYLVDSGNADLIGLLTNY